MSRLIVVRGDDVFNLSTGCMSVKISQIESFSINNSMSESCGLETECNFREQLSSFLHWP